MKTLALYEQLIPQPRQITEDDGELPIHDSPFALQMQGSCSADIHAVFSRFVRQWGGDLEQPPIALRVHCEFSRAHLPALKANEDYRLCIGPDEIRIDATEDTGLRRALSSLQQLLAGALAISADCARAEVWNRDDGTTATRSFSLPCLTIEDTPRYPWRGIMLDCARHFLPLPSLLRTLQAMAYFKLNVLHLHLTDDQAFRFPSTAYPKLAAGGDAYTLAELQELVAVAAGLGIRVVPELDMPGHTTAWLAAYPECSLHPVTPTTRFGVHPGCLNPCAESTYEMIGVLFDELAAVFPDSFVHIGGDEVHKTWWREHPTVQAFMQTHALERVSDLQNYFNTRVVELLAVRGKRALGWDEVLHPELDRDVCVQSWRGASARDAALDAGHACVVSAPYYLDLFYPTDLHAAIAPDMPLDRALSQEDAMRNDPRLLHVAQGIAWTDQWRKRAALPPAAATGELLGGEACLWSELVNAELVDVRLWSRMPILAELFWRGDVATQDYARLVSAIDGWQFWGPAEHRNLARAFTGEFSPQQWLGLNALGIDASMAGLLAVLEPVKWYARLLGEQALQARLAGAEMPQARPYQTTTPLNTVADLISPQSGVACAFGQLLGRWRTAALSADDTQQLLQWVEVWMQGVQPRSRSGGSARAEPEPTTPLTELADRLQVFARLLQTKLVPYSKQRLTAKRLATLSVDELEALQAPVGELLLGCVAPVLSCLADE